MELEETRKSICRKCKHYNFNINVFYCKENGKVLEFINNELECPKGYWQGLPMLRRDKYE